MGLQIFVEDQLNEAYEVLASKALGLPVGRFNRKEVKASLTSINDLTSFDGLLNLVVGSHETGYNCIIFILDQEALPFSIERREKLREFKQAFQRLCNHLDGLPVNDDLKQVKVIRVVCRNCLESWLVSDPQAIVDAVRSGRGVGYDPPQQSTENLTPRQALDKIVHIIREVGKRTGKKDLLRLNSNNVKSKGKSIAQFIDPLCAPVATTAVWLTSTTWSIASVKAVNILVRNK